MQPYESSDIGMYELERERIKRRDRLMEAQMNPELFKKIKHHKDCVHTKYLLHMYWPCDPRCEVSE